jgi:single-stranded DNA-binding protein
LDGLQQLRKVNIMKNTVTLVGFVGNTPEVRNTQSGASITTVSLATTRSFKDGEGNRQTETGVARRAQHNGTGSPASTALANASQSMSPRVQ